MWTGQSRKALEAQPRFHARLANHCMIFTKKYKYLPMIQNRCAQMLLNPELCIVVNPNRKSDRQSEVLPGHTICINMSPNPNPVPFELL